MSLILALFEAQMLVLATAIIRRGGMARRSLGALLIVLCGMLTPFAIGYAGFYDRWPWLSFAPFAVPLAMGPLLYAHLNALVLGRPITRWHAALPAAQFAYQAVAFCLPLDLRGAFDREVQRPWLDPILAALLLVSMVGYAVAGLRAQRRHQGWLLARRSNLAAARRVRAVLIAYAVIVAVRTGYLIADAVVAPLSYFDMFGFYVVLAMVGNYLAIEGWRQADDRLQPIAEPVERDWRPIAAGWMDQIEARGWWRDPDLDLTGLARRLGTNTAYLSRGLNEGLSDRQRAVVEGLAQAVLDARELFPNSSLDDLYDADSMPPALRKAHGC